MKRLLALVLVGVGWLALRQRQAQGGQSPTQVLDQGKAALSKVASDVKSVGEKASAVASDVQKSSAQKAEELRTRLPGVGGAASGATVAGLPTTEQPPDDSMLVGEGPYPPEAFPYSAPPEASPSTYASEATGPESASGSATYESTPVIEEGLPDPLTGNEPASNTTSPGATIVGSYSTGESDLSTAETRPESDTLVFTARPHEHGSVQPFDAPTEEVASFPDLDVDTQTYDTGVQEATPDASLDTSMEDTQPLQSGESTDSSDTTEGLLLDPVEQPVSSTSSEPTATYTESAETTPISDTLVHQDVQSSENSTHVTYEPSSQDQRMEGGSDQADRIYDSTATSVPGSEDTEDTAREIGRPGPVADAGREDLQSISITPESNFSSEMYQNVEVSLPPETMAAMENMQEGAVQSADLPIEEGSRVEATDGGVGDVTRVVHPGGGVESYMVVKEGLLFKTDVNIPFSAVDRVEGDTVYLKIEKQYVKLMEGQETPHVGDVNPTL